MSFREAIGKVKNKVRFMGLGMAGSRAPLTSPDISVPICLFAAGLTVAFCLCMTAASCFERKTAELKLAEAERAAQIQPAPGDIFGERDYKAFVSSDPFGTKTAAASEEKEGLPAVELSLDGTLSPYAAYLNGGSGSELVLKGQEYMGFRLISVGAGEAKIEKDGKVTGLYMPLSSAGGGTPPGRTDKPSGIWDRPAAKPAAGVETAAPGKTGSLSRDLVDKLLMNPYEEVAKIRMVPSEKGMKIIRIADDSILASVGVVKNDIIKAVNGVTVTNLGDATNAINSMMSGTRFDITVEREGSPVELKYEVK